MRRLFFSLFTLCLLFSSPVLAMDYTKLKEGIFGYRNLTNTPEAPLVEFSDKDGNKVTLDAFKGKTVLLNFWATWCPPCIREMPALNELATEFKEKDFVVVAIATGRQGREKPDTFLKKRKLNDIISYHDPDQNFMRMMNINTLPVSFMIDKEGKMQGGVIGMTEWNSPEAKTVLRELLN